MRIFFSVGEPSGDLHGANLIRDLRAIDPNLNAVGFGGPKMADADCRLLYELTTLAVMGLWSVLKNIRQFFRLLAMADRYFSEKQVDAVVLIDFPGFNWWVARKARRHGIPVFYYGVPQMWAWAPWRVKKLKQLVDYTLCKLPFEEAWFAERGCKAHYVGHPYFDEVFRYKHDEEFLRSFDVPDSRLLVLLPGSRTQEVRRNLVTLLESARKIRIEHPDVAVAVACFSERHAQTANEFCRRNYLPFDVMVGRTPELISIADACIACSGSVSLELLHYRTPSVIVYRVSGITRLLGRFLLQSRYITLVNLLSVDRITKRSGDDYDPNQREGQTVPMPEYLTIGDCSDNVAKWIAKWFSEPESLAARIEQLDNLARGFAETGASTRAAHFIAARLDAELPSGSGSRTDFDSNIGRPLVSDDGQTRNRAA